MSDALARKKFTEFKERTDTIGDAELDDYLGESAAGHHRRHARRVEGRRIRHRPPDERSTGEGPLVRQDVHSPADVQPLVCLDDDGNRFSNVKMGKGEASLWLEEFRGEVTATMVYDGQPVHDHFKRVDDDAVMGIMNGKGVVASKMGLADISTSTWSASRSRPAHSGRFCQWASRTNPSSSTPKSTSRR